MGCLCLGSAANSELGRGSVPNMGVLKALSFGATTIKDETEMKLLQYGEHVSVLLLNYYVLLSGLLLCLWTAEKYDQSKLFSFSSV